jgi:hypothetical protein
MRVFLNPLSTSHLQWVYSLKQLTPLNHAVTATSEGGMQEWPT